MFSCGSVGRSRLTSQATRTLPARVVLSQSEMSLRSSVAPQDCVIFRQFRKCSSLDRQMITQKASFGGKNCVNSLIYLVNCSSSASPAQRSCVSPGLTQRQARFKSFAKSIHSKGLFGHERQRRSAAERRHQYPPFPPRK